MYRAKIIDKILRRPGTWNGIRVGVFCVIDGREERVGEYIRNYPTLLSTFFAFESGGQELALYSPEYTATRILRLPDCVDIGGEEPSPAGSCPVEFFVPNYVDMENLIDSDPPRRFRVNNPSEGAPNPAHKMWEYSDPATGETRTRTSGSRPLTAVQYYSFGFVSGCIWGDDSTYKVQFLDLSKAREGIISRNERFGYLELPEGISLRQAIDMVDYGDPVDEAWTHHISIATRRRYDLRDGSVVDPLA